MQIKVSTEESINWNATDEERIAQNVANLLRLFQFEVPFDRARGLNSSLVDLSSNKQVPLVVSEIYRVIEIYEPRCQVVEVEPLADGGFEVVIEI